MHSHNRNGLTCLKHRAAVPKDDGSEIIFKWHFSPGVLRPRMSALELAEFLLGHMPSIVPLLSDNPRVQQQFKMMLDYLKPIVPKVIGWQIVDRDLVPIHAQLTEQEQEYNAKRLDVLDNILPWIQSVTRGKRRYRPYMTEFGEPKLAIEEEDDIIILNLNATHIPERTNKVFY